MAELVELTEQGGCAQVRGHNETFHSPPVYFRGHELRDLGLNQKVHTYSNLLTSGAEIRISCF